MIPPYQHTPKQNEVGFDVYYFNTENGDTYRVWFDNVRDRYFRNQNENIYSDVFEFGFENVSENAIAQKRGSDVRIFSTIITIIKVQVAEEPVAFVYNCDTLNGSATGRQRLFRAEYRKYLTQNPASDLLHYDKQATVIEDDETVPICYGLFITKSHPQFHEITAAFASIDPIEIYGEMKGY